MAEARGYVILSAPFRNKTREQALFFRFWRKREDSNLRYGHPHTRFRGELLQPLGHASVTNSTIIRPKSQLS